jgi:late competence protein required for DNA uptake (superfamily II DNA/RNA helicase)
MQEEGEAEVQEKIQEAGIFSIIFPTESRQRLKCKEAGAAEVQKKFKKQVAAEIYVNYCLSMSRTGGESDKILPQRNARPTGGE